ncbi:MAG TPA: outer membrane protein assembly factor BamA [Candidatus Cybelea sp.]|nr:outer membrane protein assembly factor BamA [Candidatus Cybelea sp.]
MRRFTRVLAAACWLLAIAAGAESAAQTRLPGPPAGPPAAPQAATRAEPPARPPAPGLLAPPIEVPTRTAQAAADTVKEIRVEGTQRIEPDTVRSYMQIAVGDRVDPDRIDKSLKALFATGLFADVSVQEDAGIVLVKVVENPIINRIAFEGNRHISEDTLTAEVQLKARTVYTRSRVQSDVQRIVQLYRRGGRFAATVEPKVIQLPQNRVDLVFEINEGDTTKIARIRFVGNHKFSDSRLREAIATRESAWWRILSTDDNYDPDRLTLDREQLRHYYLSHGYADFRVVSAVAELTPSQDAFFITFTLEEGEQYKFGKIDVESEIKEIDASKLKPLVTTKEGETYDAEAVEQTIEAITFELGRLGYAFVDVRPKVDKNREKKTVGVTFVINEGPRVYVERINITGNVRTLDKVIRREFRLAEGDAFNTAKLQRSRQRIRALGFFEKVNITQVPGSAPDRTVINVDVQEKSTGELSFGVGFSTAESVLGTVTLHERNLLGRGQDLRTGFSLSTKRQEIDLGFTEPYFLDREIAAGFDVFHLRSDFQSESSFNESSSGLTLRAGYPITEQLSQGVNYKIRSDRISGIPTTASLFIQEAGGTLTTSSIGHVLAYDRRDDKLEPTKGYFLRFGQDFAGLGGVRFVRTTASATQFFPITDQVVFSIGAEGGNISGYGGDPVHLASRFFVGGDDFRGFASGGVGPHDTSTGDALGANNYYIGTAEVSFPIGLPSEFGILGRTFAQAGSAWGIDDSGPTLADSTAIRTSAGVGLSWKSPFGPVRVDLGIPIQRQSADKKEIFRFNFGTRF